jgi:hypothetical protein
MPAGDINIGVAALFSPRRTLVYWLTASLSGTAIGKNSFDDRSS